MKKFLSLLIIAMFVMAMAASVYADAGEKLKGGAEKFFKSPLQVKDHVEAEYKAADFKPFGVIGGGLKGLFYMGKDMVTGLWDVLTFPIDFEKTEDVE